nr:ribonuclease H-like domain-containing protein [Tanacetum cinerariifolium]
IVNDDAPAAIASVNGGVEATVPPKTTAEKIANRNELKAKSTMLLAIPDEHLLKFYGIKDAKTLWEAIKTRFRGNKEFKKMQKTIPKQQYKNFVASRSEDTLSMYDLYNNLKVYEANIKGQSRLSPNSQNVAFVSLDNNSNTNEAVNTAHSVFAASSQGQASTSTYADDEMDLKWQAAMLTMRVKRIIKKTERNMNFNGKETIGFHKTEVECYNYHRRCHFTREYKAPKSQGNRNGDNTRRVVPVETPANALYDQQREILNKANLEIIAYQLCLESLESRIIVHQKNETIFEEDITFLKYDVKVRDNSITELKCKLEESLKEKYDLKLKLKKFETSTKNLTNLLNSQLRFKDKTGLGYDSPLTEIDLSNKSDVFESVSDSSVNESEEDNNQANDRYKAGEGYHVVLLPYTGNFMPPRPDLSFAWLDDSVFKSAISKPITSVHETETSTSKTSKESIEKPKTVRPSAPIIED